MAINLSRLTTGAMNINADHEKTLKASIIYHNQLIGCITYFLMK